MEGVAVGKYHSKIFIVVILIYNVLLAWLFSTANGRNGSYTIHIADSSDGMWGSSSAKGGSDGSSYQTNSTFDRGFSGVNRISYKCSIQISILRRQYAILGIP